MLLHSLKVLAKVAYCLTRPVVNKLDESRLVVCDHLTSPNHTPMHRRVVGVMVIMIGVVVSKLGGDIYLLHFCCDALGYGIHGMGLIPFIANLEKH